MIKEGIVNELHRAARRNFKRRHTEIKGLNDLYQADLVEMIPYAGVNKGYKYILVLIDAFSKFAWVQPLKNKTAKEVTNAMKSILDGLKVKPKNIQTDQGKEFYNTDFQNLMKKNNINHYSTYSNIKAAIVERFNRTLKNRLWKMFSLNGNYKWVDLVQQIVKNYNESFHTSVGMCPNSVNRKNWKKVLARIQQQHSTTLTPDSLKSKKNKLQIGDYVRISKYRQAFAKGYKPSWSSELFKIKKIQQTNPVTYILEDENGEAILGGFYSQELQRTNFPNVYLVEKILRRKGDKILVKWLSLPHPSWISKKDLV